MIIKYLPQLHTILSYMIDVFKEAEIYEDENIQSSRCKLGGQKGQSRLQDNDNLTSWTDWSFDVNFYT